MTTNPTIPTAAAFLAEAATIAQEVALVAGMTAQQKLRGLTAAFDYNEPLPDLHIRETRSWEPAARRYWDLTEEEKVTLALAHEQRTANLIALYSMDDDARQGMVDGAEMHGGKWTEVTRQITERLGL